MYIISWNVIGMNGLSKKIMLKRKIQQDKTTILFIQETKFSSETLHQIMEKIWKGCQTMEIDATGVFREITISWNPADIVLSDSASCSHVIFASFHILRSNIHGHLLNVYNPQPPKLNLKLLEFMN